VPGNIFSAKSTGVNKIIQEGAYPVMGMAVILAMTVTSTLTMMELKGMVKQVGSMQFVVGR
jgi:hypothetical protein